MRIGIITFHASHNYGSMLQAWALQTYLEKQGHEVEIVDFRSAIQKTIYHQPFSFRRWDVALASLKRILLFPDSIRLLNRKWHLFEDFIQHDLRCSAEFYTADELERAGLDYDLLICGSDQIWNTGAPDSGEPYYGNWFNGRKISYAASLGPEPEQCDSDFLRQQMQGFDAVSVREQRSLNFLLKQGIIDNGQVVCDPTLLLDVSDYSTIMDEVSLIKGDYVFFYTPVGMPYEYFAIASEIGKDLGCKVITEKAYYPKDIRKYGNIETFIPTGPSEFLNLIRHAKCVCGGSFHLQVFSILFQKDFYCINGDKDSRTNQLLTRFGLQDRIVSLSNPHQRAPLKVDYQKGLTQALDEYRESSILFLNQYLHESTCC